MNTPTDPAQPVPTPAPKKSRARRILRWVLAAVAVLLLFVIVMALALPGILSGGWGKQRLLNIVNAQISGSVAIDHLKLTWFGNQTIDGLTLSDPAGQPVAAVKHIDVPVGLWSLATGGRDLGTIEVDHPVVTVVSKNGQTNLIETVSPQKSAKPAEKTAASNEPFQLPVQFKLKLTQGRITAKSSEGPDVVFDNVNVTADASQLNQPLSFDLSTLTQQGELSGNVVAVGSVNLATGEVLSQVDITGLPTAGLDTLVNLNGLLTAALGPTLTAHATLTAGGKDEAGKFVLDAQSANFTAHLSADADKNMVLTGSGSITFNATPQLAKKLTSEATTGGGEALAADVPATLTITKFVTSLDGWKPSQTAVDMSLKIGGGRMTGLKDVGDIAWSDFSLHVNSDNLAEKLHLKAGGQFNTDGQAGSLDASADVAKLFDANGRVVIEQATVDADATLSDVPVALIDRLAGQKGQLLEALGDRLTALVLAKSDGAGHIFATFNADSTLNGATASTLHATLPLTIGQRITLTPGSAATVTYAPPAALLKHYAAGYSVALGKPIALSIDTLDMPTPMGGAKLAPADMTVAATLTARDVQVADPADAKSPIGPLAFSSIEVKLTGDKLDKPAVTAAVQWTARDGMVATYASNQFALNLTAKTTLDPQFQPGIVSLDLAGESAHDTQPLQHLHIPGEISAGFERFKLTGPAVVAYRLLPSALPATGNLTLTLDKLEAPVKQFALSGVKAVANAKIPAVLLAGDPRIAGTTLHQAVADVNFDGSANALTAKLDAKTQLPNQPAAGTVHVDADLKNVLTDGKIDVMKIAGTAKVQLADVPTAFVDAAAQQKGLLIAALGDQINVDATLNAADLAHRTADLTMHSALLDASGSVSLAEGQPITLTKPLTLTWTLEPAAYAKLAGDETTLLEPVKVTGTIKQFVLPATYTLPGAKIDAQFNAGKLAVQPKGTQNTASVSDVQLTANSDDLGKALTATLTGQLGYMDGAAGTSGAPVTGKLDADAKLSNLFDAAGKTNLAALNADVTAHLSDVPTASLDALAKQNGLIVAALGDKVTLGAETKLQSGKGPVTVTLAAPQASAKIPAQLDAGVMTLTDTMTATFMMTEQLSRKLIDHPLLKQAVRSENPVKLTVQKDGFSLPLSMLTSSDPAIKQKGIEQIAIAKATIDPGKLVVNNAGLINTLVTLPDTAGKLSKLQISDALKGMQQNEIVAWFTPMDITVAHGVVTMSRMDMLIGDNYQVATWGVVNLGSNPAAVNGQQLPAKYGDMVLGITERALRRIYGITAFKDDPNYVDQFVMRGPLDKLSPDTKELTARMAFLTVGGSAAKIGGDKIGDIVGDVMKGAAQIQSAIDKNKKNQQPAPAPFQPYPWPAEDKSTDPTAAQQTNQTTQTQPAQTDPTQDQPKEKPAEKIINNVLKDIFGKNKK